MIKPVALTRQIATLRAGLQADDNASDRLHHAALLEALADLRACLDTTRLEIGALQIAAISQYIHAIEVDLGAVADETAGAAERILDTCEELDQAAADMPDACLASIRHATTRIFEACGFQDMAGQRIARIGRGLTSIENKIAEILAVFNDVSEFSSAKTICARVVGPQMAAQVMRQSAVDKLFGSLS